MDWRQDGYTFYCDGKEVSRCGKHISQVPQFILLTTEVQGYRFPEKEDSPYFIKDVFEDDAFIVDYVRVFDRIVREEK